MSINTLHKGDDDDDDNNNNNNNKLSYKDEDKDNKYCCHLRYKQMNLPALERHSNIYYSPFRPYTTSTEGEFVTVVYLVSQGKCDLKIVV